MADGPGAIRARTSPSVRQRAWARTVAYRTSTVVDTALGTVRSMARSRRRTGLVFHHIPKCAGSSVAATLRKQYAPWQHRRVPSEATVHTSSYFFDEAGFHKNLRLKAGDPRWKAIHAYRLQFLHTLLNNGAKAVSGHVYYHPGVHEQYQETHSFVTILRHPVDRFVSQYFFNKYGTPYVASPGEFDEEELEREGLAWGSALTCFLGGGRSLFAAGETPNMAALVGEAKKAIETLNVVGFVDRMDLFQRMITETVGIDIRVGKRNTGKSRSDQKSEEVQVRELAQKYCEPDLEVYEHARTVWDGRTR